MSVMETSEPNSVQNADHPNPLGDPPDQIDPVMEESRRIKAAFATVFIERSQALYRHSGNPMHAWRAFDIARHGGVPVSDWVLDYLDHVAKALTAAPGPSTTKAVADALGLGIKGGPSMAQQARTDQRHLDIVEEILFLQERSDREDADLDLRDTLGIMQRVAGEYALSLERVQALYYEMMHRRPSAVESPCLERSE